MNWLLAAVAVILLCCAYYGYRQGILRIILSMGSLIVAIVLSMVLNPYVNSFLRSKTDLYKQIQEKCGSLLEQTVTENPQLAAEETPKGEQDLMEQILGGQTMPDSLKELALQMSVTAGEQAQSAMTAVADGIADLVMSALSFMITLVVVRALIWMVFRILRVIEKLPIIHGVNQFAGLAFGLLEGLLVLWIFFIFLTCILQTDFGQSCMSMITESRILTFLYDHNLLNLFFMK